MPFGIELRIISFNSITKFGQEEDFENQRNSVILIRKTKFVKTFGDESLNVNLKKNVF